MADKKISQLNTATTIFDADVFTIVQDGETKRANASTAKAYAKDGLSKSDVGLGNVDNTSDANKPVSTATQTALDSKQATTAKNAANGYAGLDANAKLPTSLLPALAISEYLGSVANQAARLALTGQKGDWCSQTNDGKVYVITGDDPTDNANWTALTYPVTPGITLNGTSIAPGDTATISAATTNTLTIGTGLSGTSFNGSSAVTVAIDSTVATLTGAQTLTGKTISGADNTLSNIGNSSLTNSSITINGNAVSLGGSTTVSAATTNTLTIGAGLTGTSFNGSSAVTIAIDSSVVTLTGTQTLTNKTLTSPAISGGTVNNVAIGGTTPAAGAFTTLSASSTVSGTGFSTYLASPPAIGGTAPAAGAFTTLTATLDSSFTSTGALLISKGTTGEQPGSPVTGMIRYNTSTNQFEGYSGSSPAWSSLGGGGGGSGTVTSVSGAGTVSGITLTGTVTTSGSLTLGGTLNLSAYNAAAAFTNLSYTGTLTGGTGVIAIGTNQIYKDASGNVGIGTSSTFAKLGVVGNVVLSGAAPFISLSSEQSGSTPCYWRWNSSTGVSTFYNTGIVGGINGQFVWVPGNGTQAMTLDSSGNLGLGVTPSAWSAGKALEVGHAGASFFSTSPTQNIVTANAIFNGGWKYAGTGPASYYQQNFGSHSWFTAPSGTAGNAISFTQAMTLDANANLLVGTTSKLAGGVSGIDINSASIGSGVTYGIGGATKAYAYLWTTDPSYRIETVSGYKVIVVSHYGGVQLVNGATSWSSYSDERAKTNLIPIQDAAAKVSTLRAVTGRFNTDKEGVSRAFLIAQDVQAVLPEAVDNSDLSKLSLRYTETIPLLVAAIQELHAEIETLKQRIH